MSHYSDVAKLLLVETTGPVIVEVRMISNESFTVKWCPSERWFFWTTNVSDGWVDFSTYRVKGIQRALEDPLSIDPTDEFLQRVTAAFRATGLTRIEPTSSFQGSE